MLRDGIIKELIIEYDILVKKYSDLLLDFVLLEINEKYLGESIHKEAILIAFKIFNKKVHVANQVNMQYTFNEKN